jgi:hypothetical protein
MTELPEPLVPADVDLQGFGFMPLYGTKLFGSDFNSQCNDAEWRAGVTLWWAAWNQVPAASLPDSDVALCRLADLGRDLDTWHKLKANALHGFVKCSDGRLYHKILSAIALDAWGKRVKERTRKAEWRKGQSGDETRTNNGTGRRHTKGQNTGHDGDGNRDKPQDKDETSPLKGEGEGESKKELQQQASVTNPRAKPRGSPDAAGAVAEADLQSLARGIIAAFDRARTKVFGAEQARPFPVATDIVTAMRWAGAGYTEPILAAIFEAECEAMLRKHRKPPGSLKFFSETVTEAMADMAKPAVATNGHDTDEDRAFERYNGVQRAVWELELIGFRNGEKWLEELRGPSPSEPGCRAPPDLLAKILPGVRLERAVH